MRRTRCGFELMNQRTGAGRMLACIATLALLAIAVGCATGQTGQVQPTAASSVQEDGIDEAPITGVTTNLEVEDMQLTNAVQADDPGLKGAKAVRFEGADSVATGSIRLETGKYKARLYMLRPDGDHDAVTLAVGDAEPTRVFRGTEALGPTDQAVEVDVQETSDVKVEIKAVESGMLLDRVEFERLP
jgi:hypothetical protein